MASAAAANSRFTSPPHLYVTHTAIEGTDLAITTLVVPVDSVEETLLLLLVLLHATRTHRSGRRARADPNDYDWTQFDSV